MESSDDDSSEDSDEDDVSCGWLGASGNWAYFTLINLLLGVMFCSYNCKYVGCQALCNCCVKACCVKEESW